MQKEMRERGVNFVVRFAAALVFTSITTSIFHTVNITNDQVVYI